MSFINIDVHSEFFTPQEYPVELLEIANVNDIIACCLTPPAKQFLAFMLIKEYYYKTNGFSVFIQNPTPSPKTATTTPDDEEGEDDESPQSQSQESPEDPESSPAEEDEEEPKRSKKKVRISKSGKDASPAIVEGQGQASGQTGNPIPVCHLPFESLTNIPTERVSDNEEENSSGTSKDVEEVSKSSTSTSTSSKVFVCTGAKFLELCKNSGTGNDFLSKINLIVIDNVHEALKDQTIRLDLQEILRIIRTSNGSRAPETSRTIRTVFLTVSLLHFYGNESDGFWRMEETFKRLETLCGAQVDTTSDVVALLRYSTTPKERIVQFQPSFLEEVALSLTTEVRRILEPVELFLRSHSFDALAAYGFDNGVSTTSLEDKEESDSLIEELRKIPHPKTEPLQVLEQFLRTLETFGPWCAYRSLILLIHTVEKLKVRTPYERHYLLLGALHTRFTLVQKLFTSEFKKYEAIDVLERFSTPKLRACLQILRRFDLTHPVEPLPSRMLKPSKLQDPEEDDVDEDDQDPSSVIFDLGNDEPKQNCKPKKSVHFKGKRSRGAGGRKKPHQKAPVTEEAPEKILEVTGVTSTTTSATENGLNHVDDEAIEVAVEATEDIKVTESKDSKIVTRGRRRHGGGGHAQGQGHHRLSKKQKIFQRIDESSLCGIIFVENRFDARILFHFLKEASFSDPKLIGLNPTIAIDPNPEYAKDSREAEMEHKRREECLKKFRYREANILIGTALLEEGIELPKANLVIRFDPAKSFRSYLFSKGRAQGFDAEYYVFSTQENLSHSLRQLSTYKVVEQCLISRSIIRKPEGSWRSLISKSGEPEDWDKIFPRFRSARLSNSIAIVNRYCARLPSDTFTRLVPLWSLEATENSLHVCHLRLPINSAIKWIIKGVPMPSLCLAKQAVALQTVQILHANGELDDSLMPIGKESVRQEPDLFESHGSNSGPGHRHDELLHLEEDSGTCEFRPGSTKRRQYYLKQLAPELSKCLPRARSRAFLYWVRMILSCPLPEEQNTRGRKLHPPEDALQCFGILLGKALPPLPPFPIYTRCGEVQVQLVQIDFDLDQDPKVSEDQIRKISAFHHYTFTSVLRLDKYVTLFDPSLSENSYYVVPLSKVKINETTEVVKIDWDFMETIWLQKDNIRPKLQPDEERKDYEFKPDEYLDAVVMPWYRNHDVPQYFYVAEICENLTPRSQFPGCEFKTFEEYYNKKYHISIQNAQQPLLDVDHTSARLNFLTPRYVNRKGMALPTSSESTKKAKRENLEQKQILVPELCAIHPFSASLWRQAVCLPCILYRMNCILLANNIRIMVASQVHGLGKPILPADFEWEPLSFGWTLSDVVAAAQAAQNAALTEAEAEPEKKSPKKRKCGKDKKKGEKTENQNQDENGKSEEPEVEEVDDEEEEELTGFAKAAKEATSANISLAESLLMNEKLFGKSANEILSEEMKKCRPPTLEIGTWSNEMASETLANEQDYDEDEDELLMDPTVALPSNLMMLDKNWTWGGRSRLFNHKVHRALYGSPTHWGEVWDQDAFVPIEDLDDCNANSMDADNMSVTSDMSGSDESFLDEENNFKIQFHNGNTAEALDKRKLGTAFDRRVRDEWAASEDMWWQMDDLDDPTTPVNSTPEVVNGHSDQLKEDFLRKSFENRVEEEMKKIRDVVEWNSVKALEPRTKKVRDEKDNCAGQGPNPQYEKSFQELTSIRAPPPFPESDSFRSRRLAPVVLKDQNSKKFSFDFQPSLDHHVGPSPCQILQALTMSNANDGLNLERLETIGDSFLKYAITSYLFCTFENIHEGKLSHLRSKQVSNVHLYRLGRRRGLGGVMVATKFEPHDNWLPPGYRIPKDPSMLEKSRNSQKVGNFVPDKSKYWKANDNDNDDQEDQTEATGDEPPQPSVPTGSSSKNETVPYNLVTQQSIPDKSIADCVEALIGAYLTSMGPCGALLFMSWLGIRVLPSKVIKRSDLQEMENSSTGENKPLFFMELPDSKDSLLKFENLEPPNSPLLRYHPDCESQLETLLKGYENFEHSIGYSFRDRSYLLQAFTHASYTPNNLTDCYQRLEFLGDAILDYLITRHLYEDPLQHSPGSLTDLRSALVNNTIFASLAVKNGFHKFFRHCSPGLAGVLQKFVAFQEQHGHTLTQDYYLMDEEECEEAEDIEVPKALGDVFESVAGAIFLDSGMSLDAVWDVYYRIMKQEIEEFSKNVPKSPIRELLELEPETAKFGKPEKLWDGRRVRVSVDIFGVGTFRGIGRNYRIAKCTAAKCALRHVRKIRQSQQGGSRR